MAELITRRENAVGWVIFSNPAKLNAVSHDMWMALPKAIAGFDADPEVRLIVITGDGDKAFISGADISQFEKARGSAEAQAVYNRAVVDAYEAPVFCSKPVVAKIRGICMGGGLGLAAACDVRIAAADAAFRMPAGRLGLGYNYTGIKRFAQLIGPANTADIFFSARKFNATDALGMGFVNRVVPVEDFDREVAAYCEMVAENAPLTLAAAKFAIRQTGMDPAARDLEQAARMIETCFNSEDYREGRRAFMQKRKPSFRGK
ncbi:MAG: enoyl-CoA hydratase [Betaproteobacteria bacterium RIFCSPLOWO2_12_FULL_64_23]|nr:MAG: enoyl-CoA hydratase [Betaproteobacteria bacterium RIFCSPLOWO2_12_FULL_64_23]